MESKKQKGSVMEKVAQFIVDKRNLFFLLYIAAMIFCMFSMNWKSVETDVTVYLNGESETRQGIDTMNEHFAMFSSARVMVSNVTYDEAVAEYERCKNCALGRVIAARELPVVKRAKEILDTL